MLLFERIDSSEKKENESKVWFKHYVDNILRWVETKRIKFCTPPGCTTNGGNRQASEFPI
jgi:hypothetical protein